MNRTRVEENLLILLDPRGECGDQNWSFVRSNGSSDCIKNHNVIYCFNRRDLVSYFLCLLKVTFRKKQARVRKVLYINDGLLCSLFFSDNTEGYRAFVERHVPLTSGLRSRFSMMLPPLLRAEQLFVSVETLPPVRQPHENSMLDNLDVMFYSNAPGKLLLTNAKTFISGKGMILKTTSSPDYAPNLEREYVTVRTVAHDLDRPGLVPDIEEFFRVNSRFYYPESYLNGENLRSRLRSSGQSSSHHEAIHLLERLDDWFKSYHDTFSGTKKSLHTLYGQMITDFSRAHAENHDVVPILGKLKDLLTGLADGHEGLVPVVAHNDLWPGNFIISGNRLIAIDWERATTESAPLFDYYWMIIAAIMEYRVGQNGYQDYSIAFRQFLSLEDDVCSHARKKLDSFLDYLGFCKKMRTGFLLLFLMEWSIQGARALGVQTAMDRLALGELLAVVRDSRYGLGLGLSSS